MKKMFYLVLVLAFAFLAYGKEAIAQEQAKVAPKKVQVDTNYDGKIDRTETYNTEGKIEQVESDTTGDGKIDEWVNYKAGKPIQSEKDTNADGKPDVWVDY
ncbi:MAG: hypothetical protein ISS91_01355 [Candidatus Omnitrophica bacterium]|nr:hypothetical protein [Candidatus Omnitrophota bacterium]